MKTKRFRKKLTLKKTTIADIEQDEMNGINGGDTGWPTICNCKPTYPTICVYEDTRCQ